MASQRELSSIFRILVGQKEIHPVSDGQLISLCQVAIEEPGIAHLQLNK